MPSCLGAEKAPILAPVWDGIPVVEWAVWRLALCGRKGVGSVAEFFERNWCVVGAGASGSTACSRSTASVRIRLAIR